MVVRRAFLAALFLSWVSPVMAGDTRTVTDLVGRNVALPARIERIACLAGTTCEKVLLLGQSSKVVVAGLSNPAWMARVGHFSPGIVPLSYGQAQDPNIEDMILQKVDVVFFRNDPLRLEAFGRSGVAAVVSLGFGGKKSRKVDSVDAFTTLVKDEVRLYGDVLGGDAPKIAAEWVAYFDEKVKFIGDRVASIPLEQRPKVYGVVGPATTHTYGQHENSLWYVEMAGGRMVTKEAKETGGIDVSMEQVMLWNPDIVFIGHSYSSDIAPTADIVAKDPRWKDVKAVKEGRIYPFPAGVDYWDRDSEGVLLMEYLAKTFYPDRFADLDMVREVIDYYRKFYKYELTREEAQAMLAGRQP